MIKEKRCKNTIPSLSISWITIHEHLKTRSVDDIRNYWNLKLVPLMVPSAKRSNGISTEWTEENDLELLNSIIEQHVDNEHDLDFDDLENGRSAEQNRMRWAILLRGVGGLMPGQRIKVREIAAKILKDIQTKHERYVPWADSRGQNGRNGRNQFINIVEYFRKHFR